MTQECQVVFITTSFQTKISTVVLLLLRHILWSFQLGVYFTNFSYKCWQVSIQYPVGDLYLSTCLYVSFTVLKAAVVLLLNMLQQWPLLQVSALTTSSVLEECVPVKFNPWYWPVSVSPSQLQVWPHWNFCWDENLVDHMLVLCHKLHVSTYEDNFFPQWVALVQGPLAPHCPTSGGARTALILVLNNWYFNFNQLTNWTNCLFTNCMSPW